MAWHSTHSRENDGLGIDTLERAIRGFCAYSREENPAHFLPIICSTGSRHVFLTCHDCPISWNRFCPDLFSSDAVLTPFAHPSRAGAAYKGGNYASFDASCRCYPAAQVQSPSPGLSEQPPNISDQKLDAAAAAIERVASLKQDYQQRIAAAAPADKERILNEAVNALAKAVTDQGLSLEEYDSILEVAQNDPDVREKIRQRIRPSAQ
jgi:Domain of unknown function (DUF4168)